MHNLHPRWEHAILNGVLPGGVACNTRFVAWRPGELEAEIDLGAWDVLEADAQLAMRKPEGLWEELVRRSQRLKNTI